jgi:hypothetical protein
MNTSCEEPVHYARCDAILAFHALREFIGRSQRDAIRQCMAGEERQFFYDKMVELECLVAVMHKTYEQRDKGDDATVWLHYFKGGCDWYISEKDIGTPDEPGQHQAFGFANLGDAQNAELGYISIVELLQNGVELDLHFNPRRLSEVKGGD